MAHIPDGFLSPPILAGTAALSAAALAAAARRTRTQLGDRQAPILGAVTAFVFAAQMFNFPLGAGTSAHLLGGVLVAAVAGPWAAMLVMFSVVLVQALLFQDGGVAALGANTLNLAVLGAGGGYVLYRWIQSIIGNGYRSRIVAGGLAAFGSAVLTGAGAAFELAFSGVAPLAIAFGLVAGAHVVVGIGEAVLTGTILAFVLRSRPVLVEMHAPAITGVRRTAAVVTTALAVAATAAIGASGRPDALSSALDRLGLVDAAPRFAAPFAGYSTSGGGPFIAAAAGVAVVFAFGWVVFRLSTRADRLP